MNIKGANMEEKIEEYFTYRDGALYWLKAPGNNWAKAGDEVKGFIDSKGYRMTRFKNKPIMLSHIVFYLNYNFFPDVVRYKDGNVSNIAIENLIPTTQKQVVWGASKRKGDYTSKYKGLHWRSDRSKWRVTVKCHGVSHYVGLFDDERIAAKAYNKKAMELFGSSAYLNNLTEG